MLIPPSCAEIRFANGVHRTRGFVKVVDRDDAWSPTFPASAEEVDVNKISFTTFDPGENVLYITLEPLVIEKFRVTQRTLLALLPLVISRGAIAICRDNEQPAGKGADEQAMTAMKGAKWMY